MLALVCDFTCVTFKLHLIRSFKVKTPVGATSGGMCNKQGGWQEETVLEASDTLSYGRSGLARSPMMIA
jgi:hypothetical protein